MEIALCVLLLIIGFTPVVVASYKVNKAEKVALRVIALSPAASYTVYPSNYADKHLPMDELEVVAAMQYIEHDIDGYFNKENN